MVSFGVVLPQGVRLEFPPDLPGKETAAAMLSVARKADELGYDHVWLSDHVHTVPDLPLTLLECWTSAAAVAAVTSRVRIGQMVTYAGFRNPALLAKMGATLNAIASGRLDVGLGAGWYEAEARAYGYPFPSPRDRLDILEECLQVIRLMWTNDAASFDGQYYSIRDARCTPRPLTPIPLWVGGGGMRRTLDIAARLADGANFSGDLNHFKQRRDALRRYCEKAGRDPRAIRIAVPADVAISADSGSAHAALERHRRKYKGYDLSFLELAPIVHSVEAAGSPEEIASTLRPYLEAGASDLAIWFADEPDTDGLELFMFEVAPLLRAA
jgi:F420-dependent oxidoreductase-like protein